MAKKKDEEKVINSIDTKEIIDEIKTKLTDEKNKIITELQEKVSEQVEVSVEKRMKEEEKKFVRGKNAKIFRRDLVIIILLAIVGYFSYCLYDVDYFNIFNRKETAKDEVKEPVVEKEEYDNTYYINKYGYLVKNMQINDQEIFDLYNTTYSKENISDILKLKIAYYNMPADEKTINNNLTTFSEENLISSAKKIFGNETTLPKEAFEYNNTRFLYFNEMFLGESKEETKVNYLYNIYEAKEEDNVVTIKVMVAKVTEDNQLLNLNDEVVLYNYNNEDISIYKEYLDKYTYTFELNDNNYTFSKIEKN